MVLEEPSNDDQIEIIDGITVAIDHYLAGFIDDAVIDVQKYWGMEELVLRSSVGSSC